MIGRFERWLLVGSGHHLCSVTVTGTSCYFSVTLLLQAAQAFYATGAGQKAEFEPLMVLWGLIATWLLAHSDVQSDWDHVAGRMAKRLQTLKRQHQVFMANSKVCGG